jgi:hypothetical protein
MEPIAISDTHDPGWYYVKAEDDWVTSQGVDSNITWRYEVYIIDIPFAKFFQYGARYYPDRETIEITVPITSLPKINEWRSNHGT